MAKRTQQFNIFSWVKEIFTTKRKWSDFTDEQQKLLEPYMINKFISMNKKYIEIVNIIQQLNIQDKEKYYTICCDFFPVDYKYYSPYIKGKKQANKELLSQLSTYFNCSNRESSDYIELLDKSKIKDILEEMGMDKKDITKINK